MQYNFEPCEQERKLSFCKNQTCFSPPEGPALNNSDWSASHMHDCNARLRLPVHDLFYVQLLYESVLEIVLLVDNYYLLQRVTYCFNLKRYDWCWGVSSYNISTLYYSCSFSKSLWMILHIQTDSWSNCWDMEYHMQILLWKSSNNIQWK